MPRRLLLLGPPRLQDASGIHDLPLDRPASLGYHLALRGDWVRRAELADLYSPEADESAALSNLRKLAHRLRQQGWADTLESDTSRLRLRVPTDVQAFRAAVERHDWAAALELHRGPLLEGLAFADLAGFDAWLELERQDLARSWRMALLAQVQALEAQARWQEAERWLARLMRLDPLDEEALQAWMRVLQAAGQPARARDAFERFRCDLRDELGVEPLESTRALADRLHAAPTTPSVVAAPRHHLPEPGGRFVGRAAELSLLSQQLARADCRLLSVLGLGGMGKTRLALELARQQLAQFADGVWWAHLSEITRTDLLVPALAAAVGLVFGGPSDLRLQLMNYLRDKSLLLVLDNFEHLLEGGDLLEELLSHAPGLKLLVTSRAALETASEWSFDLDGLPCPAVDQHDGLDAVDAVRLFIARAERFSTRFAITPATLRDIGELARQVQGMPLALELAATWTRGLAVADILAQWRQGVDLLQTRSTDVPERQRRLQAVLDHSWQLLSEAEQATLARLAVFRGGFALEAAQRVAGAHLGLLLRLINQALLRRAEDGRYELHELVRQFAERRLPATERASVLDRFGEHFRAQLLTLGRAARGAIEAGTVAACRREFSNIITALGHLASTGQTDALAGALPSLHIVVDITGLYKVGATEIDSLTAALQRRGTVDPTLGGGLQAVNAYFLAKVGAGEPASRLAASAITALESCPPCDFLGLAYGTAGICRHLSGDFDEAITWYGKALEVFSALGNRSEQCRVLNRLAVALKHLDRYDESDRLFQQALDIARADGDLWEQANLLNNYGINFESTGRVEEAISMYRASLEISERIQFQRATSAALTNLGHVHERRREYLQARDCYEQSLAIKRSLGEPVVVAVSLTNLADVLYELGEHAAGHSANFQTLELTLAANARSCSARALWSLCKFLDRRSATQAALRVACFLGQAADCERWVRDEAAELIDRHLPAVGQESVARLREQATSLDHAALLDWIRGLPEMQVAPKT